MSGGYQFRAAKEDTRDSTIKRSDIGDPRLVSWIRSHSEKSERAQSPDEMDKSVFRADAVTAFEHEAVKTLSSTRLPTVQVETLECNNITNEIIPMNEWHFRSAADLNLPILDDSADYQHRSSLHQCTSR
jgi:hypothetical protein